MPIRKLPQIVEPEIIEITQDEPYVPAPVPAPAPAPVPVPPAPKPAQFADVEDDVEEDEDVDDDVSFEEDDDDDDEDADPAQQLMQLLVTEDGTPLVDVLANIQATLDKQNKILFKLVNVLDARLGK